MNINGKTNQFYIGDMQPGDRLASDTEVSEWQLKQNNLTRIAEIYAQLADIDAKSIRSLAEGDAVYLATLRSPVVALRDERKTLV